MNSEQIRKMPIPNANGNVFDIMKPEVFQNTILREIAAQLADLNAQLASGRTEFNCNTRPNHSDPYPY